MKFFRFAASRTSFLAFGFCLAVGITTVFAAWTPSPKNPLDPLYSSDWNSVAHNTSSWEREGDISAPGENVFLNTTGGVGIGNTTVSNGLKFDIEGKIGATEYCDENGLNCTPADEIGGASGGNPISGIIDGGGLEIQNGLIGMVTFPCAAESVMKFQNGNWQCAPDEVDNGGGTTTIHDITCNTNEIMKYSGGGWVCATDESGTGAGYWQSATGGIQYNGGSVGIGTASPSTELEIYSTDGIAAIRLADEQVGNALTGWEIQTIQGADDAFAILNVENNQSLFHILKSGKIGILETNPAAALDVNGNIIAHEPTAATHVATKNYVDTQISGTSTDDQTLSISGSIITIEDGNSITLPTSTGSDDQLLSLSGNTLSLENGGTVDLSSFASAGGKFVDGTNATDAVYMTGNVGIGVSSPSERLEVNGDILADSFLYNSDARLKNNVNTISGLDNILALRGVEFEWNENGEKSIGFIAQEVETIFPEIVSTTGDGYKSVDYSAIIAPLVEAIKEQQEQIDALQKQVEQLQ